MKKFLRIFIFFVLLLNSFSTFSANYFWVGGSGAWSNLSHWATTSGGSTFHTVIPTLNDNVIFDTLSFSGAGQTVTLDVSSANCDNMDWSLALFAPTFTGPVTDTINVYGSLIFNSAMTNGFLGDFYFRSPSTNDSILTNGHSLNRNAYFTGTGTYNLRTTFSVLNNIYFLRGTLKTNNYNVSCTIFNASSSNTRSLQLGSSTVTVSGSGVAWDAGTTGMSLTSGTSKIIFTNPTTASVTFNSGGVALSYNVVNFQNSSVKLLAAGTFDSLQVAAGSTVVLPNAKTQFLGMLIANGTCGSPIIVGSDGTLPATISKTGISTVTCNFLRLSNVNKSGAGAAFVANNSIMELGPCTNWTINASASATTLYWIGGNGKWSDASHWSLTSGGAAGACIPGPGDNVVFNTLSGFVLNDSVIVDKNSYCNNMTWTGALANPRLAGTGTKLEIKGSVVFVATMTAPFSGNYKFVGTAVQTINTAGVILNGDSYFNGTGGQWQLTAALNSTKSLIVQSGHLNTQNNALTCSAFTSTSGTGRQLTLGSSIVTITSSGNAWNVVSPLTLSAGTSEIICSNSTSNVVNFIGGALVYNHLTLNNYYTAIFLSNTFKTLKVAAGKTLTLQTGTTQNIDTIKWTGTCSQPITVECSQLYGPAASINKTGDTLTTVSYVYLKNVVAFNTAPVRVYNATNSVGQYTTTGWTITGSTTGGKRYWIGGTGNWSDSLHWSLTSGGAATTCIPTAFDTVYFDANSFSATGQIVNVDVDGYCKVMDWTGAAFNPKLYLIRNVIVKKKATLNALMTVERSNRYVQFQFLPSGNNADFDSKKALLNTDILFEGQNLTDTLNLLEHMYQSDTTTFTMVRGTFITNNDSINTGAMNFLNIHPKTTRLGSSYVDLTYGWNSFTGGTMTLNAGTSTIKINGHTSFDYFYGDGRTYNNVIISSPSDTTTFISGSNTFNNLTLTAGVEAKVTASTTQTITGNFTALGTCTDSIAIFSSVSGTPITITKASGTVTTRCMRLKDIARTGAATFNTLFSTNLGSVTGWTFTATPPVTANFTRTYNICLGASSTFTNTSTSYLGGAMTHLWNFGDGTTSTATSPTHTFASGGKKYITLTSTYTASNCSHTRLDSVLVNAPIVALSCSEGDSTICAGGSIQFDAAGQTGSLFQFLVNGTPTGAFSTVDSVILSTITNGQIVTANVTLNGCPASSSQAYTVTVNPLPNVVLNSSDADDIICSGTSVTFTASGAHLYEFFVNGVSQGFATTSNSFIATGITAGQVITVTGTDTLTGCVRNGLPVHTMTVNGFPTPTMTCSTTNLICAGTSVTFTATGASLYQFFVNGVSQGPFSATSTFTTATLTNGSVVTLQGSTNGCASTSTSSFTFTVNPIPSISVSNNAIANTICAGQSITFTAGGATLYEFFVNGVSQGLASGSNTFSSSSIANGQTITVNGSTNGCLGTSSATSITVNPLPVVSLISSDADNSICLNESVTFTAGGASTYEFFVNGVSQGAASASTLFTTSTLSNGQTVTVKGFTALTCSSTSGSSFTFTVLPLPTVNFYSSDADNTICAGQSITFTGLGANIYEFFVNGISQGPASTLNTFTTSTLPAGSTNVSVNGTSVNGCSSPGTTAFNILVNPQPVITLTSSDADNIICNGTAVTFSASGASSFQFFVNGVSQGPVSALDTFNTSSLTNGQIISVSGSLSGCASTGTSTYTMTVNPSPSITLGSSDVDNIICQGQAVIFTAGGGSTFQFFVNGISQGPVSATTTFNATALVNADVITVQGSAAGCSANGSSAYTMNVNPLPVVLLSSSDADTSICTGNTVNFTASGANLYEFFINGISQGAASPSTSFSTSSILNGQTVTATGTTNYGCSQSSLAGYTFNVDPLPTITLTSSDADGLLCTAESVTFTAGGALLYEFFVNGVSQGAPGTGTTFTSSSITNLQTVSVEGSTNGCTSNGATTFTFNVYPYPTVNLSTDEPSGVICTGQSVTFTAGGAGLFEFFIDGVSQGAPSASNTFITTSITNGQTITVNGINIVCAAPAPETYLYTVFNYPVVAVTSSDADNIICYGDIVTFTASGASTYEFFINGLSQGPPSSTNTFSTGSLENTDVVSVEGYNGNCGSFSTTTFSFTVNKMNLDITSAPANLICQGSPITFTATGADLYQFFVNGTSQGPLSATNTFNSSSLNDGDIVTFTGNSTGTGCVQPSEYEQFVNVMATPSISANGPITFCQGDSVQLQSNSSNGNQWMFNGSPIAGATDSVYFADATGLYSVAVTQGGNGSIWSLGANINGQLGDSTLINSFNPQIVKNISTITDVDAGNEFNIALNAAGSVYVWGDNAFGNLGDGTFTDRNYPFQLTVISGATSIAAGGNHSLVVSGGNVLAFGNNNDGQLGIGSTGIANFPTAVAGITGVDIVSAGEKHSLALKSDGTVWAWGDNQYGQLGDGTLADKTSPVLVSGLTNVIAISAGKYHSMVLRSDSSIWVWGNNAQGQLGNSSVTFSTSATPLSVLGKYTAVSAGGDHSLALNKNGSVYSWGDNQFGQLGDGTTTSRYNPLPIAGFAGVKKIKAGTYHNFSAKQDQSVWAWGNNPYGQVGNATSANVLTPTHITALSGAGAFAPGLNHTSVAMMNEANCSSNTISVFITPAPPVVIYDNVTFLSTDPGSTYQWYFENSPILDGVNQTQPLIGNGQYIVQVTYVNGCTVTSENFGYMVGVEEFFNSNNIRIWPNPASEQFTVTYKGTNEISEIWLSDVIGKKVMAIAENINSDNYSGSVNTTGLQNGIYLLNVRAKNNAVVVQKVIIGK